MRFSRRSFLRASLATVAAPAVHLGRAPVKVRVLGTHVTLQEPIRKQAEHDLGIELEYEPGGSSFVLQKAATRPEEFDVYEQWSDSIRILWQAGAIKPIEVDRLEHWGEINALTKTGRLTPEAKLGAGDAPYRILNVQADGSLGDQPSGLVSFMPYVHNADSFGYDARTVTPGKPYETESWSWLLDERWAGRVGMVNAPTIGLFDMALAVQAAGLMTFADIGQMTRDEVDTLIDLMVAYKRRGHFSGVWNSVPESVEFMQRGRVVIESMFSPAVTELNASGVPAIYAAPREGYRAWHGVMCLSSRVDSDVEDAAYRFMNWWLSGWPGAFIARQGYYIANPERARERLSDDEWGYWYDGQPAVRDLPGTDGRVAVAAGSERRGGSYRRRLSNVAVWNTVMDSYEYSLQRWYDFLSS